MIVIGLTGSIGMGKTETAKLFASFGIPVYDADQAVHRLYAPGGAAVEPVGAAFPGVVQNGAVDRKRLAGAVLEDPQAMARLEAIVHPLVAEMEAEFRRKAEESGAKLVVLDIPLLFEAGGRARVDKIVVVSAPLEIQRQRVLERADMTEEKFAAILSRQMPDSDKRRHADFIIDTGRGLDIARVQVAQVIETLLSGADHA